MNIDMAQKRLLVDLTTSQGWYIAKKIAETKLNEIERTALDCDDETRIAGLVRGSKFARTFWDNFLATLENSKKPDETPDEAFTPVCY